MLTFLMNFNFVEGDMELRSYFNEPRIGFTEDPFLWWQKNSTKYRLLSGVARKFLGISATEVASERVFSSAGNIVTKTRSRLTGDNVEKLVFLNQNLKNLNL